MTIDINADLGEGAGFDQAIMPWISSCSIACGGHFGTGKTIAETISLAKKHGVSVGAHPSFPDPQNFGRTVMTMTKQELYESVLDQIKTFYTICDAQQVLVNHIKLHGALYNYAAKDAPTADAVVEAIIASGRRPKLYVPHGSILHKKAENLLPLEFEAFIDRQYNNDLSLVSRDQPGAVITDPQVAWEHLYNMFRNGKVRTFNSEEKSIKATTFCVHGDNPSSVSILKYMHEQMKQHGIRLK